jgi:kynurenine formamidase
MMKSMQVVDLTAILSPATVMWPGQPPISATVTEEHGREGSYSRQVTLGEHSGTHFDAPCHFSEGAECVADVPADQLVRPLRVIDIADRAAEDPDTVLTIADITSHETEHGRISTGSAVFLRTGWDSRRADSDAYAGPGGEVRFPGFGVESARFLVIERSVAGLGIDTLSIDPGHSHDFEVHRDVSLPRGVWHVENAINLDAVPAIGAWVVVGVPRVSDASGFPARVLALVPRP